MNLKYQVTVMTTADWIHLMPRNARLLTGNIFILIYPTFIQKSPKRILFDTAWFSIDLFFTDHPSLVKSTEVISGVSDHEAVTIENNLSLPHRKQPKRRIYLWNKADPIKIRTETRKFAQDFLNNMEIGVNDMWTSINSKLLEIMNKRVPSKESSSLYFPPWITPQNKRYIRN